MMIRTKKEIFEKLFDFGQIVKNKIKNETDRVLPKTRKSNPISKVFRGVFEGPAVRQILGMQIAVLSLVAGAVNIPMSAFGVFSAEAMAFEQNIEVDIKTESVLNYPVPNNKGISQTYHVFHPGLDIRADEGAEIKPIMAGTVSLIATQKYGWGRRIEIDHGNGVLSLYAHLGKIYVQEGDYVTTDQTIAEVGMTGRTTGPHLHLEVHEDGKTVNPINYLRIK